MADLGVDVVERRAHLRHGLVLVQPEVLDAGADDGQRRPQLVARVRRELALTPERLALCVQRRPDGHQGACGVRGAQHAREHQREHATADEHLEQQSRASPARRSGPGRPGVTTWSPSSPVFVATLRTRCGYPPAWMLRTSCPCSRAASMLSMSGRPSGSDQPVRLADLVVLAHEQRDGAGGPATEPRLEGWRARPAAADPLDDGLGAFVELADPLVGQGVGDRGVDGDPQQQQHRERGPAAEQHQPPANAPDELGIACLLRVTQRPRPVDRRSSQQSRPAPRHASLRRYPTPRTVRIMPPALPSLSRR